MRTNLLNAEDINKIEKCWRELVAFMETVDYTSSEDWDKFVHLGANLVRAFNDVAGLHTSALTLQLLQELESTVWEAIARWLRLFSEKGWLDLEADLLKGFE